MTVGPEHVSGTVQAAAVGDGGGGAGCLALF